MNYTIKLFVNKQDPLLDTFGYKCKVYSSSYGCDKKYHTILFKKIDDEYQCSYGDKFNIYEGNIEISNSNKHYLTEIKLYLGTNELSVDLYSYCKESLLSTDNVSRAEFPGKRPINYIVEVISKEFDTQKIKKLEQMETFKKEYLRKLESILNTDNSKIDSNFLKYLDLF